MGWWRFSRRRRGRWASRRSGQITARIAELGPWFGEGPRPEFRAALRDELMRRFAEQAAARASRPAAPAPAGAPPVRRRPVLVRMLPSLVFSALLVLMFSTGVRTYHSVPGEPLYPLKRMAECTVLSFAHDDDERAQREMTVARRRAAETASLVRRTPARDSQRLIGETLDDMEVTTRAALTHVARKGSAASTEVRRFAREQRNVVEPLLPKLDRENQARARKYLIYIETFTSSGP
ncbi:hypothetical protein TBS_20700 [Thermobispora bispora]|jgi:hypothetical protein